MEMGCPSLCHCGDMPRALGSGVVAHPREHESQAWSALHIALCKGHRGAAQIFVTHEASKLANPDQPLKKSHEPYRSGYFGFENMPPVAIKLGYLHAACMTGDLAFARWLINRKYVQDVDVMDESGLTPLAYAYLYQH
jgi:hypothetical protein